MGRSQEFLRGQPAHPFHAARDINRLFPSAGRASVPWEQIHRVPGSSGGTDREALADELEAPFHGSLHKIDPRDLLATQPHVWRTGVEHYLNGAFESTGLPYVDQLKGYNQHPVVYRHEGQNVLVNGHHRAAAALLQGRQFDVRMVRRPRLGLEQLDRG